MEWQGLDDGGELTARLREHFIGRVYDLGYMIGMTGHLLDAQIAQAENEPLSRLPWRHVFASVEQIILNAGRISSLIRPTQKGKPAVRALRTARAAFMRSVFDDESMEPVHDRTVRNRIEHYDERIEDAIVAAEPGAGWMQDFVGPEDGIRIVDSPPPIWSRRFDPPTGEYVAVDETVNVLQLLHATNAVYRTAEQWLEAHAARP
ncbi:MAG: hypothetical protein PIR02_15850 [Microbacterium enclense]